MIKHTRTETISNEALKSHLGQKTGYFHGLLEPEGDRVNRLHEDTRRPYRERDFYIRSEEGKIEIPRKDMKKLATEILDLRESERVSSVFLKEHSLSAKVEETLREDDEEDDDGGFSQYATVETFDIVATICLLFSALSMIGLNLFLTGKMAERKEKAIQFCEDSQVTQSGCLEELGYDLEDVLNEE
jgi:hypothetical protein